MILPDWAGRTVVCVASGPSLVPGDCDLVRASGHPAIVTNTTFRDCLWADALFGWDINWWRRYIAEVRAKFHGRLFGKSAQVRALGVEWLGDNPAFVPFSISGASVVSVAVGARAARVILLGFDSQRTGGHLHHHGDHPAGLGNCESMPTWPRIFARVAKYARAQGVEIVNASRETALTCFERRPLEACL